MCIYIYCNCIRLYIYNNNNNNFWVVVLSELIRPPELRSTCEYVGHCVRTCSYVLPVPDPDSLTECHGTLPASVPPHYPGLNYPLPRLAAGPIDC